jgi:hypothetical protein
VRAGLEEQSVRVQQKLAEFDRAALALSEPAIQQAIAEAGKYFRAGFEMARRRIKRHS